MIREKKAVVMGGSAGALQALSQILPALPADFSLPILIVVHLPPDKKSVLPEVLGMKCALPVSEAEDKTPILPGRVYVAPPDYHLLVESETELALSNEEPLLFSRPSIDVLFESAADVFGSSLIGVILSGANNDGALGLSIVIAEGGLGIVQDAAASYASAMPDAARAACPSVLTLNPPRIAERLIHESRA
jgi:two-component system chemotaxis response regulator CheB